MSLIGRSIGRVEDAALLRGRGRFVADVRLPDELHAAFVRSPHGHAAIGAIDTAAARALPGVHAVLSRDDLLPHVRRDRLAVALPSPSYRQQRDRPVLAGEETVHVGEPIAIAVADSRALAEDAAALVEVAYEPLPAVGDCRAALALGAPSVHRDAADNLLAAFEMGYGDVEAAFAGAAHVFRETIWQHRGGSHSIECRGTVARHDPVDDRLTLWMSTQMPHEAARILGDLLGRDADRLRVITPDVGGGFGPKLVFYPEDVAVAVAALLLRRPVKWIEDRREHFVATTQERDQHWDVALAVEADGRIRGVRGVLIHDHGAHTARGVNLPFESAQNVTLAYRVPAYRMDVKVALTNKVPVTPVRGAGQPQGAFVMERLLDRAARALDLDRAEIRRRNLVPADAMPYAKPLTARGGRPVVLDSGDYPACQRDALARAGWDGFPARQRAARATGRYLGIGLANFVKGTGRGPFEAATVRIGASGDIHVYTGAAAMGQGTHTMLAQIVADQLGGDPVRVTVTAGDTAGTALGFGGFNSRQAVTAGSSAHVAAVALRAKVLAIAAHRLEVAPADLEIAGERVRVAAAPDRGLPLAEIARAAAGTAGHPLPPGIAPGLEASEHVVFDDMAYANGSAVAEVEVDVETGVVAVLSLVLVHDAGRLINPMIVDGQIIGGAAHGLGNALLEWMGFDENCQPTTITLGDYLLVSATEMPAQVHVLHRESPSPLNPLGVKGVGECGVMPTAAAIASAIEDALAEFDVRIAQAPIRPHDLLALLADARRARS